MSDLERGRADASSLVTALRVVRERGWLVGLTAALTVAIVLGLSFSSTKQYDATATLLIQPSQAISLVNQAVSANADPERDQATALLLVTSGVVVERVKRQLKSQSGPSELLSKVTAASEPDANLISVTATDPSPPDAARLVNAFAAQFASYRLEQSRAQLDDSADELRAQLGRTPVTLRQERQRLTSTLSEVLRLRAVTTGGVEVVGRAGVPGEPSSPKPKRDGVVALLLGLVIGIALAFLIDLFDRRVKGADDFEALYGLSALVTLPERGAVGTSRDRQVALEPFRILRNNVAMMRPDGVVRILMVTSAVPGEGKSTVAAGLARAIAGSGQSVALVEADLRRPTFHEQFELGEDRRGLSTALVSGAPVAELARAAVPGVRSLLVVPSGPIPPNAAELLRSPQFSAVLEELTAMADIVILDAPPMLPVADSQVLLDNELVDACIVVARAYLTTRDESRRARAVLERHRRTALGLVVNGLRELDSGHGYYGKPDEPARRRRLRGRVGGLRSRRR